MSGENLSFLIADDHPMVRDALASALGQAFGGAAVALAGSLAQVQTALEREPETDALLLDLDMPGMDGLTGLALLRSDHPTVPIIVVSAARDAAVIRRAYEFGASAYIDKSASLEEIANTVRAVLDGEIFAPAEDAPADSFAQRAARLTPQQWRVLALMIQGDQNKQIAYKLGVGEATVKAHVTVILRKLGVRSRTQAVIEARGAARPAAHARPGGRTGQRLICWARVAPSLVACPQPQGLTGSAGGIVRQRASITACVRERTPSLRRITVTCAFTVASPTPSL